MTLLQAEGITKRYGGTLALAGVDFEARPGAVSVVIGENGAGKSTLMRILAGVERPTAGRVLLAGRPVAFGSVREAAALGIGIVHQELNFCPNLTVAENIFLTSSQHRKRRLLDPVAEREAARALLARLGQAIEPDTPMGDLRIGQQQIVEIAKALAAECRVLILDEPTSALSATEVEVLFRIIAEVKRSGVAIIYISHRLEELLRIGDVITVLRDGRVAGRCEAADASIEWIVERMLGKAGHIERRAARGLPGRGILTLHDLTLRARGGTALEHVSAEFRAGELTAVYGLLGAGRTELLEAICGLRQPDGGSVRFDGHDLGSRSVAERVAMGVLLVPEDRQREGLFANLSVGANMSLADLRQFARFGVIASRREREAVARMMTSLGVKASSPDVPVGALSGGNQQKVVIGRCLLAAPSVILLDEPSRGVDIGARAEIFATMEALAGQGLAVVFTTSDVLEALAIADRVIVLANGGVSADVRADAADEQVLIGAANRPAHEPSLAVH